MKKRADSLFALAIMQQNKTHVGGCHECRYESIVELVHDLNARMVVCWRGFVRIYVGVKTAVLGSGHKQSAGRMKGVVDCAWACSDGYIP